MNLLKYPLQKFVEMTTFKYIFAMQLRLNLESKNGRRYTILKSKNWLFTFYIIKLTRITMLDIAVPKSLVPSGDPPFIYTVTLKK